MNEASVRASERANSQAGRQAGKPAASQAGRQAGRQANRQTSQKDGKQARELTNERANRNIMTVIVHTPCWYPYPTLTPSGTVRRSSTRPCIESGSCIAAQRQCTELIVAKYGTEWSSLRRPLNGRMLANWPARLVALTKCAIRTLNTRCGLFHPPPKLQANAAPRHKLIPVR